MGKSKIKSLRIVLTQRGLSVIEVLAALGLLSAVMLALQIFVTQTYRSIQVSRADVYLKSFHSNLMQVISDEGVCTSTMVNTLNDAPGVESGETFRVIRNRDNNGNIINLDDATNGFITNGLGNNTGIPAIQITQFALGTMNVSGTNFNTLILVNYQYTSLGQQFNTVRAIPIFGNINGSNVVTFCSGRQLLNPDLAFISLSTGATKNGNLTIRENVIVSNTTARVIVEPATNPVLVDPLTATAPQGVYMHSDKRLKDNIKLLNPLPEISLIKTYRFNYKGSNERRIGLLAQEVQKYIPQAVVNTGSYLGIRYDTLIPIVWEDYKQLKKKSEDLQRRYQSALARYQALIKRNHASEASH